jgi:prepilin-type N-terminal cleavage/methylation domain-containing protein
MEPASGISLGGARQLGAGFTLIELMLVCAIMGILITIGVPTLMHVRNHESFTGVVADVADVCATARARAVLHGTINEVVISPANGSFTVKEIQGGEVYGRQQEPGMAPIVRRDESAGLSSTAQLSNHTAIEMLDVNFVECKDADEAYVRFFPNGTSDCFTLVIRGDRGEWRTLSLDEVTGLVTVKDTSDTSSQ